MEELMVDCDKCRKKIITDDETGYATVKVTISPTAIWPGPKSKRTLCEPCLAGFEKKVGYED